MKAFILSEADFEALLTVLDRDPEHGTQGGSSDSSVNDPGTRMIYDKAHRFYNYQIRRWIDSVKK